MTRSQHFLLTLLLTCAHFIISNAACGDIRLTQTVRIPTVHANVVNLPPQFTDVGVVCDTNTHTLCSTEINAAGNTITLDTTILGAYTNLNDYDFLRSNKSIFPTFGNEFIITPTFVGPIIGNNFGVAVAISGDGTKIAIGSLTTQMVDIYQKHGNQWLPMQQLTLPPNILNNLPAYISLGSFGIFGSVLALSYDGTTLAVSGIPNPDPGIYTMLPKYVFLYTFDMTSNTYVLHQTIAGSGPGGFGQALALSADGKYLVISEDYSMGAPSNNSVLAPTAWVYARSDFCSNDCISSNRWSLQARLIPTLPDGTMQLSTQATPVQNVAISADGSTIALGYTYISSLESNKTASASIFKRTSTIWQQSELVECGNTLPGVNIGVAVALSADGQYLASGINPGVGTFRRVCIFLKSSTSYQLQTQFTLPSFSSTPSIGSISLSADGTVLTMGGGRFPYNGAGYGIYIVTRTQNNSWIIQFRKLSSPGTNEGYAIRCSADGAYVIVGEPGEPGDQGRAYIFQPSGSFIPNDAIVTGTLCVYQNTAINAPLHVAGDIHLNNTIVTGTGLVTPCAAVLSDTRTKDNLTRLDPMAALEKLRLLQPITFFWKDTKHNAPSQQIGFIAQHMQKILPHWVNSTQAADHETQWLNDDKKYMITMKAELYAYLIAALERLVQRNAEQKQTIVELQQHKSKNLSS